MTRTHEARVDFHLHSYASNVTDYYAANTFAIPESYSDPIETYHALKAQGMDLVTLTDHNSIDGALEMLAAGFTDVFISAEMTTTFPEDGCNIHVTVANMTEAQFREIDRLRSNVYDMIDYVERQIADEDLHGARNKLAYFMTHPLMSTQNRPYGRRGALTVEHIEKAILLCPCLEVHNGTRTKSLNDLTLRMLESLTPERIERLANKHAIEPNGSTPWRKAYVGGSDDHSGINPGQTWTVFRYDGARPTPNDVIESIRRRETRAEGAHGGPVTLAHAVFKLLHDGQRQNAVGNGTSKSVRMSGPLDGLLKFAFGKGEPNWRERFGTRLRYVRTQFGDRLARRRKADRSFEQILTAEAYGLLGEQAFRDRLATAERTDDKIFTIISELLNRIFVRYVSRIRQSESVDLVRTIKETVALITSNVFVSLPYFMSYVAHGSDKFVTRDVRKRFGLGEPERLALVTDTLFEVNGVAKTVWRVLDEAERRGVDLTVVTCLGDAEHAQHASDPEVKRLLAEGRLVILRSLYNVGFPEYEGLQIRFPPLLEFLKLAQERGFTKMQLSTPGTMGIAGLFAAKLLQIETAATYHTSFPEYVENYTQDISLEAMTWKYMILFYHAVDEVVVPSKFIAKLLHQRGLRKRKLLILDRWVDLGRFSPARREPGYWAAHGVDRGDDVVKFVYVGRIGREKNLDLLADAFRQVHARHADTHLILIGDGPYREELSTKLADLPVTFTGFLGGDELPVALASADAKLFPSMTDTWGNAPLEAQACGLPVVVSDRGGPQELMEPGVTGHRVDGMRVDELVDAMVALLDGEVRSAMGDAARAFVERGRLDRPFSAILEAERYRRRAKGLDGAVPRGADRADEDEELSTVVVTPHREERMDVGVSVDAPTASRFSIPDRPVPVGSSD